MEIFKNRKLRNFLLDKDLQLRYWLMCFYFCTLTTFCNLYFYFMWISQANENTQDYEAMNVGQYLTFVFVNMAIIGISSFFFMMVVTHRTAGPVIAIKKFVEGLKSGDYEQSLNLRKHDDFQDLAKVLNELKDTLRENNLNTK